MQPINPAFDQWDGSVSPEIFRIVKLVRKAIRYLEDEARKDALVVLNNSQKIERFCAMLCRIQTLHLKGAPSNSETKYRIGGEDLATLTNAELESAVREAQAFVAKTVPGVKLTPEEDTEVDELIASLPDDSAFAKKEAQ